MTYAFKPRRFAILFDSDRRNVFRDPTMVFAILLSAVPAPIGYLFRDAMNAAVLAQFGIADIFSYLLPIFLSVPAFMIGWVTGFLFLEDRDDGPLLAVDVTPVGKRGLISYRIAITAAITFALTLFGTALLLPERGMATALVLAVMISMDGIGMALILPALARNKVEGLAVTKAVNILSFAPLAALLPLPWRYLAGVIPTYWVGEVLYNAPPFAEGGFLVASTLGIGIHLGAVWLLYRLQARRAG